MNIRVPITTALIFLLCANTFAQQPLPKRVESSKYRTIFTLVGAGGGFALGFLVGFSAFDDAVNSDRKLWTTAAGSAAGGAIGGYFLGRSLDKRGTKAGVTRASDEFYRALTDSQRPSRPMDLVANSRKEASVQIFPSSSLPASKPGGVPPLGTAEPCELNHIYLRAALESMYPSE